MRQQHIVPASQTTDAGRGAGNAPLAVRPAFARVINCPTRDVPRMIPPANGGASPPAPCRRGAAHSSNRSPAEARMQHRRRQPGAKPEHHLRVSTFWTQHNRAFRCSRRARFAAARTGRCRRAARQHCQHGIGAPDRRIRIAASRSNTRACLFRRAAQDRAPAPKSLIMCAWPSASRRQPARARFGPPARPADGRDVSCAAFRCALTTAQPADRLRRGMR